LNLAVKLSDAEIHFSLPEMEAMRPVADQMLATIFTDHKPEYSSLRAIGKNFQIFDHKRDVFASMLRVVFVPTLSDWQSLSLPAALQPLYYIYRPLRLLHGYASSLLRRLFRGASSQPAITPVKDPLTGGLLD